MTVDLLDYMGGDQAVVDAARVSFHKVAENFSDEQNQKLINYLAKHNHWSPFAHSFLKFRVKAPIFVSRQLMKHVVGLAWNEVSRRYVDDEPEFFFPDVWRKRAENAKQGSSEEGVETRRLWLDGEEAYTEEGSTQYALNQYNWMLLNGVAPEQARMVLPQNTMTEWVWSGSLAAFARVCKLRLDAHAQQETQEVAQMINDLIPKEFEHSWKALMG